MLIRMFLWHIDITYDKILDFANITCGSPRLDIEYDSDKTDEI